MVRQDADITLAVEDGLDALLARIDRGEPVTLTRGGRRIADVVPARADPAMADDGWPPPGTLPLDPNRPPARPGSPEAEAAFERIRALRDRIHDRWRAQGRSPMTVEEVVQAVRQGRRS